MKTLVQVMIAVEWARLLSRLQQLRKRRALVLIDLGTMTLHVAGESEALDNAPECAHNDECASLS